MFDVEAEGHWAGDPDRFCGRLELRAEDQEAAEHLARLKRVVTDPARRRQLLALLERVESGRPLPAPALTELCVRGAGNG